MQFSDLQGCPRNPILPQLPLGKNSTYDEVSALAEYLTRYWQMGDAPATRLAGTVRGLNVALFRIDAADEVSGASFRSDRLCAILVNRKQPLGRQHFSMAHELFHVLTWSALPPEAVVPQGAAEARSKTEKLANSFAAAFLMPAKVVLSLWDTRGNCPLTEWLETTASALAVSPDALFWRLKSLRKVKKEDYPSDWDLPTRCELPFPKLYSQELAELTRAVIEQGQVSVRRAAKSLSLDQEGVAEFLEEHSLAMPFGM
jgi:Zn-dependent peptidase ImmA (M78 family)